MFGPAAEPKTYIFGNPSGLNDKIGLGISKL
jgi:hypothetical protein